MRARASRYPVEDETRCLVVAPHDDDATLGCGGLIIGKRLEGNLVDVVCITDGGASHPGHPTLTPEALIRQRRSEALAGIEALRVDLSRNHLLNARDGTLAHLEPAEAKILVDRIADILARVRPDEIFLPCRRDGSSEHDAAFNLVRGALKQAGLSPRLFEYPIWSLWAPQRLARPLFTSYKIWRSDFFGYEHLKQQALSHYSSQMAPTPPWGQPVLSPEFVSCFLYPEEFFFEMLAS